LVSAILLSDNNAAHALARIGGYIINPSATNDAEARSAFYAEMNKKAQLIGMRDTDYSLAWTNAMSTSKDQCKFLIHIYHYYPYLKSYWGLESYVMTIAGVNARTYSISSSTTVTARAILPEFRGGKTGTVNYQGFYAFVWEHLGNMYATAICGVQPENMRFGEARNIIDLFMNNYNLYDL